MHKLNSHSLPVLLTGIGRPWSRTVDPQDDDPDIGSSPWRRGIKLVLSDRFGGFAALIRDVLWFSCSCVSTSCHLVLFGGVVHAMVVICM